MWGSKGHDRVRQNSAGNHLFKYLEGTVQVTFLAVPLPEVLGLLAKKADVNIRQRSANRSKQLISKRSGLTCSEGSPRMSM